MFSPEDCSESDSIPEELRDVAAVSGLKFVRCSDAWKVEGWAAKLKEYLSVTFAIDKDITGEDILDGFEHASFNTENIVAIQRRIWNRSWVVSFSEQGEKDRVISKGRVTIKGTVVFLGDADTRTDIVKIFEAPDEMPDTVIFGRLSCYGRLLAFRRDVAPATGVQNGVRTAQMRISRDIPCSVHVAGESVSIRYSSQPRSCRRCGGFGHFANTCREPRCYNCDSAGHRAMECEEAVLCGVCFHSTHPLSECPFVLFSANMESSYAEVAKGSDAGRRPRAERTPEQLEAMRVAAEAAKEKATQEKEKEKQREKERRQREKEREAERQQEKEREERRKEREKEKRKEKDKEKQRENDDEEEAKRREREKDA